MQENLFPTRADDQHRMMERLASARVSDDRAREIIQSPDAYRAFLAEVAAGVTGRLRPPKGCEDWPDDRFPSTLTISGNLIAYPHRGNLIAVVCCACGRAAEFSGRALIRATAWLARPAVEWCAALRCSVCGSARLLAASYQDPAANAFIGQEEAPVVWCRRLADWLTGTGLTLADVLEILPPPVPPRSDLVARGLI